MIWVLGKLLICVSIHLGNVVTILGGRSVREFVRFQNLGTIPKILVDSLIVRGSSEEFFLFFFFDLRDVS